ncbi:MAG: hypothetical protein K6A96_12235 [Prevotella sp.]|nr:hypothetical protein [Prevotella sp.]
MKKFVFCLVAFLGCFVTTKAQTVTVASVKVAPGSTASFSLSLTGGKVDKYGSLKFTATFPTDLAVTTTGDFEVNQTAWKGATGAIGDIDATGVALVGFSGSNFISTSDVNDLVSVEIAIDKDAKEGTYDVTLSDIYFGYNSSDKDKAGDVTFQVIVKNLETVTLSEDNATDLEASDGPVNVIVKRTIAANQWSTICLPFAMTGEQAKAAFGDDVMLAELSSWSIDGVYNEDNDNIDATALKIVFANVDLSSGIAANRPYMIKVGNAISEFVVKNVVINPKSVQISKDIDVDDSPCNLAMIGTYKTAKVAKNNLFVSENKLWYASARTDIKALRAYFKIQGINANFYAGARMIMVFGDETTDNIVEVRSGNQDGEYYNLRGQRVDTPAKGIYIKNGKKVVVK